MIAVTSHVELTLFIAGVLQKTTCFKSLALPSRMDCRDLESPFVRLEYRISLWKMRRRTFALPSITSARMQRNTTSIKIGSASLLIQPVARRCRWECAANSLRALSNWFFRIHGHKQSDYRKTESAETLH